jgi:hypothetical protein
MQSHCVFLCLLRVLSMCVNTHSFGCSRHGDNRHPVPLSVYFNEGLLYNQEPG